MSHSVKRSKSRIEQFRMVVPKDVRAVIGKTAWTESLRTTDHLIACRKRADLVARYTAEIAAAREGIAAAQAEIARHRSVGVRLRQSLPNRNLSRLPYRNLSRLPWTILASQRCACWKACNTGSISVVPASRL